MPTALQRLWVLVQVELQGQYSLDRLRKVDLYATRVSWRRLARLCLATPLPCVLITLLLDCIRVEPVAQGARSSPRLWARCAVSLWIFTVLLLAQQHQLMPRLPLSRLGTLTVSVIATSVTISVLFALAVHVGYPLPFMDVGGLVVWFAVVLAAVYLFLWLAAACGFQHAALTGPELRHFAALLFSQLVPTLVYSLFNTGYVAVAAAYQPVFICLLPLVKLATKNVISVSLRDIDDLKPEAVVFNVDIFHALFVACSMQISSASLVNIAALMAVDVAQSAISLHDLHALVGELDAVRAKLTLDSQRTVATADLLRLARFVAETDQSVKSSRSFRASCWEAQALGPARHNLVAPLDLRRSPSPSLRQNSRGSTQDTETSRGPAALLKHGSGSLSMLLPIVPQASPSTAIPMSPMARSPKSVGSLRPMLVRIASGSALAVPAEMPTNRLLSAYRALGPTDRLLLVHKTLQILYVTEFVALVEYTEVIMPVIYVLCLWISFYSPNRAFFVFLDGVDAAQLRATVRHVALYALLELLSLVAMSAIVSRRLGISLLHQLAFVLDNQWRNVQSKLVVWVVFVVQTSLVQLGSDYTFRFAWLHPSE